MHRDSKDTPNGAGPGPRLLDTDERKSSAMRTRHSFGHSRAADQPLASQSNPELIPPFSRQLPLHSAPHQLNIELPLDMQDNGRVVSLWLDEYRYQPYTFDAYRREASRLILWLHRIRGGLRLTDMQREDWRAYQNFLAAPPPEWCGPNFPRYDCRWRPFRGPLSKGSVRYAMGVMYGLMGYLVMGRYLGANPVGRPPKPRQAALGAAAQGLSAACWQAIEQTLNSMPGDGEERIRARDRARFVMRWTKLTGGRSSELCAARMGDLVRNDCGDSGSLVTWRWLIPEGRGHKAREVALPGDAMHVLAGYRESLGLPALPQTGETDLALIWRLREPDRSRGINRPSLFRLTKKVFLTAAMQVSNSDRDIAQRLEDASTHWLRQFTTAKPLDRNDFHRRTERPGAWVQADKT